MGPWHHQSSLEFAGDFGNAPQPPQHLQLFVAGKTGGPSCPLWDCPVVYWVELLFHEVFFMKTGCSVGTGELIAAVTVGNRLWAMSRHSGGELLAGFWSFSGPATCAGQAQLSGKFGGTQSAWCLCRLHTSLLLHYRHLLTLPQCHKGRLCLGYSMSGSFKNSVTPHLFLKTLSIFLLKG